MSSDATTQPAYFVTPIFIGGPIDGLQWCSMTQDQVKVFWPMRGGLYRVTGYRNGGREAVYTWEVKQ
jgi:hypothetical protein